MKNADNLMPKLFLIRTGIHEEQILDIAYDMI